MVSTVIKSELKALDLPPMRKKRSKPKVIRRGRKRLLFKNLPRPVYPVRALWDAATEEEKSRSHRMCVAILEWWLGKATREEVSKKLSLPSLRVWQLSQQALAGMLAGLLRQPRTRGKVTVTLDGRRTSDLSLLRQETLALKKRLKVAEDVAFVLSELKQAAMKPVVLVPKTPASTQKKKAQKKRVSEQNEKAEG
jgi:hypothetical protein